MHWFQFRDVNTTRFQKGYFFMEYLRGSKTNSDMGKAEGKYRPDHHDPPVVNMLGVSNKWWYPKLWMVYFMENPI